MNKTSKTLVYLGLFLFFGGISYFIFDRFVPIQMGNLPSEISKISPAVQKETGFLTFKGPKTEICPINGELYTKDEKNIWQTRRPLLVMIENHENARPQSGLQNADIVYEAMAEGGITRFMAIFYCGAVKGSSQKYDVGPVRSARTYFLDIASEYSDYPLYAHVGGANCSAPQDPVTGRQIGPCSTNKKALAIEQIADYGWNNQGTWGDLSQFSLPYKVCRREPERTGQVRDTEHTMYCSTKELWNVAAQRGLTNQTEINKISWDKNFKSWSFKQKDSSSNVSNALISFDFWTGYKDYSVVWQYDKNTNSYLRSNGGQKQVDFNTQEQISAKNIVIQFTKETRSVDEHLHNLYDMIGSGKGLLFQNGTKTEITWSKADRKSRTIFKDSNGQEINFVPGRIWIEILATGSTVNYENSQ